MKEPSGDAIVRKVYEFPKQTWIENLAVRSNGKLLVTLVTTPEVWEVDPFDTPPSAKLLYRFPDVSSVTGIAEYAPDVFAVNVGNFSLATFAAEKGSWSIWSLDMGGSSGDYRDSDCKAHKITDLPDAVFLNGMTTLQVNPSTLLVADSGAGTIYRVDTATAAYSVAIDDPYLKPNPSFPVEIGVNGVHFRPGEDDHLYFTNTFKQPVFARVPIDHKTGNQTGQAEAVVGSVAQYNGGPDDFTFDPDGKAAYLANAAFNGILKLDVSSGATEVVVGGTNESKVLGNTACQFGRTEEELRKGTLYITNTGGIAAPPPRGIEGGGVFALDAAEL